MLILIPISAYLFEWTHQLNCRRARQTPTYGNMKYSENMWASRNSPTEKYNHKIIWRNNKIIYIIIRY